MIVVHPLEGLREYHWLESSPEDTTKESILQCLYGAGIMPSHYHVKIVEGAMWNHHCDEPNTENYSNSTCTFIHLCRNLCIRFDPRFIGMAIYHN